MRLLRAGQRGAPPLNCSVMRSADDIERAVLQWFATHCDNEFVAAQIRSAELGEREVTSAGFLRTISVPENVPSFPASSNDGLAFDGCGVFAAELNPYADCILHSQRGRLVSLEVYAVSDGHPLNVTEFEVKPVQVNYVYLRRD
jgi:hypothetical protein